MTRKCPNWLDTFVAWSKPRSESPESYILWAGLFALASVLKRHVHIPRGLLGGWEAYPNLYVVFVGPPATRKTTTINFADELLELIPDINVAAQSMTQQVLMKRLADTKDCSMSLRIGELGTFINPSGPQMIDFLCALFDGRKSFGNDTLSRNLELAENPCVNFFAATTPRWIASNLSEIMVGGGFTSRTIFVYEDKPRRRQLFYEGIDHDYLAKLKKDLVSDLVHLSTSISGVFEFSPEAKSAAEEWYGINADKNIHDDYRLSGYYGRKPEHLFKLSMLLHMAHSDDLCITYADFHSALDILSKVEKRMPFVFKSVGANPYTSTMDGILEYVERKEKVSQKEILGRFYNEVVPSTLVDLIGALVAMGKITIVNGLYIIPKVVNGDSVSNHQSKNDPSQEEIQALSNQPEE